MAEEPTTENYVVEIHCHCKLTSFSLSLPSSSFPLKSALCHCNSCRHTTGQLFTTWAVIPTPISTKIWESGNLIRYNSSSKCERWFCKQCGASVINIDKAGEHHEWEVATGLLHFEDEDGLQGKLDRVQLWVEDVKADGGAVGWINKGELADMSRFWNGRESKVVSDEAVTKLMEAGRTILPVSRQERLNARCHCHKVAFSLAKPEQLSNSSTAGFEANMDACTSCRTVTGFEITAWTTVPNASGSN
ncbi:Mss4-like protein [Exophiala viscosa]|uniref:Mss4-like protein n=1 Tax=Exophiala viscosa TaxID=2486360 RepID=A0AAN6DU76_9EURO|nr:Mss4-like protein [Exophiala viscosa]KAI1625714.1 Mss4-like protein [Exophiala viscosa]